MADPSGVAVFLDEDKPFCFDAVNFQHFKPKQQEGIIPKEEIGQIKCELSVLSSVIANRWQKHYANTSNVCHVVSR